MPSNNLYSTSPLVNVGSTAPTSFAFGFYARALRLYNASSVDAYFDLAGDAPSTGTSNILKAGEQLVLNPLPTPLAAIQITTTSTGATGARVSVLAFSG